jgi:hypothetical protein
MLVSVTASEGSGRSRSDLEADFGDRRFAARAQRHQPRYLAS